MLPLLSRPGSGVVITVRPLDHPVLPLSIPISHLVHCTKQLLTYCSLPTLFIVCLHLSECKLCEHTDFCLFSSLSPAANGSQHIVGTRINICIGTWESFKALSLATSQLWPSQSPPSYGCKASQSPCVLTAAPAQVSPPSPWNGSLQHWSLVWDWQGPEHGWHTGSGAEIDLDYMEEIRLTALECQLWILIWNGRAHHTAWRASAHTEELCCVGTLSLTHACTKYFK